jgi:hypothetical protein
MHSTERLNMCESESETMRPYLKKKRPCSWKGLHYWNLLDFFNLAIIYVLFR